MAKCLLHLMRGFLSHGEREEFGIVLIRGIRVHLEGCPHLGLLIIRKSRDQCPDGKAES